MEIEKKVSRGIFKQIKEEIQFDKKLTVFIKSQQKQLTDVTGEMRDIIDTFNCFNLMALQTRQREFSFAGEQVAYTAMEVIIDNVWQVIPEQVGVIAIGNMRLNKNRIEQRDEPLIWNMQMVRDYCDQRLRYFPNL